METQTLGAVEDLRAFCAVIEFGTVSAAARVLQETKGAISRRLSRLEARLGVALLARTSRALSPTEEGLAFYAKAREALTLLDDAFESARQAQQLPSGHLRVTAPLDIGVELLPQIVAAFREAHPQITVELLLTDAALDLVSHRVDLALRASVGELPDMGYRAARVTTVRVSLYAAPGYLSRRPAPPTPESLVTHALLLAHEPGTWLQLRDRSGRRERIAVQPVIRTADYASLHRLAIAGAGIAPLPDIVAQRSVTQGLLTPVLADWWQSDAALYAVSVAGREAPARVRVFLEFLRRWLDDA